MYGKVFQSLFYGSLSGQSDAQLVFVCLIAHADQDGNAELHPAPIGALTGIGIDRARAALSMLSSPDPDSRRTDEDGKRILEIGAGCWHIVNYQHYRALRDQDQRRAQAREQMRRLRESRKQLADVGRGSPIVSHGSPPLAQEEVEVEVDTSKHLSAHADDRVPGNPRKRTPKPEAEPEGFAEFYAAAPRRTGRRAAAKAFAAALKRHPDLEAQDLVNAVGAYARRAQREGIEDRFIPHPATWLNQDRFLEEFADA